ncbi:phage tail tape measure protein [Ligilactobacillus acidipiscis]|uniref:phage tail tape measure protein n=1 Tax=Ligilactobacillus acidipiscis TaxID=89059 RepID=UPI0022E4B1A7|nr:phage tail tape measure protein [Ligilactobacillus acidipiscis]
MAEYSTEMTLRANIGQYTAAFKEAQAVYNRFNQQVAKSSMSSTNALARSSKLVSTSAKAGAVGLIALGTAALKTGADFEHQMSRVGAISGASKNQLKSMNDQAIQLGAKTAFSAKEAAEGMENLASAGMKPKQIMEAMPGVLDLAAVSGGNVGNAAENAAVALNGFGLSASSAGHVADVFARAAADTNAEASDMGEALKMVAPQAHTAGLSLEETAAAIGVLSDAGIKGSEAGSNLAMALTKVQNPSGEAQKAMDKLGYSAFDSAGKMKPLATQMSELRSKLSGMTDQQKQYYLSQIYGVQGGRAINTLLSAQSGKLENLTSKLKNSDGAAAEMAKTMQNDLKSSIEQFFGALESLSIILEQTFGGTLKGAVDAATDSIGKFNDYLQDNQASIQQFTQKAIEAASGILKMLPSIQQVGSALKVVLPAFLALETFKGIGVGGAKTIKFMETMQADLSLVQTGLRMTGTAANGMRGLVVGTFTKIGGASKTALVAVNSFFNDAMSANGAQLMVGRLKGIGTAFTGLPGKARSAGSAMTTALMNPKQAAISLNGAYAKMLTTMGAGPETISALTSSTAGLGASLGSLTLIAAGVALVATAIYAAWSSNFANIQGVVKTAISEIKGMFDSMKPSIDGIGEALKPIGGLVAGIFKIAGAAVISAVVVAVIALATALRLIVDELTAVVKVGTAAGNTLKGLMLAATGHFKEAGKALSDAKKDMGQAGDAVKDMGQAFVDAGQTGYDSFSQLGKSSKSAKTDLDATGVSVKNLGKSTKQMKSDFEQSKTDFSELINTDGVSAKTKEFLTNVNNSLDQYQQNASKASENYKKQMTNAEKQTGQARVNAVNEANQNLANATQKNSQTLINITGDLDRQLKDKRFSDGTAMTQDQVTMLTDQNNQIKQKLMEQNQIFVQAQLSRVQNGQKLNQQEREATVTTLQANYNLRAQQITAGETKIKQLQDQINQTKDQTTKAQLQQQLVTQQQHNQQMTAQQIQFGTQMNMTIANGSKLNYTTWAAGLQSMTNVTAQQVQAMFLSFVQMNNNTGQQMQAFALMLQRSGTKGVTNLVQALSTGKATTAQITAAIAKDGTDGLNTLPPGMFKKGNDGKQSFINALKSGDFAGAGKYLATESSKGAGSGKPKHKKAGQDNGKAHADGVKSSKEKSKSAGKDIGSSGASGAKSEKSKYKSAGKGNGNAYGTGVKGTKSKAKSSAKSVASSGATGAKSEKSKYKSAGSSNGSAYASGVKSKTGSARSAGKSLANAAKSGAKSVSFNSVGSQMAAGLAAGIRANSGSALSAMASLVAKINATAKKAAKIHSPSRLFRDEVGKYLTLGIAVGITDNSQYATQAMFDTMDNIQNAARLQKLNFNTPEPINNSSMFRNQSLTIDQSPLNGKLDEVINAIHDGKVIVLDSGELVGATKNKMDDALGNNTRLGARFS